MKDLLFQSRAKAFLLGTLSIGTLLAVMAGFAISVLYPISALMHGVRQVGQGDLDVQIPPTTSDEVGELTEAFNHATQTIREQREQLWRESITDHLTGAYNQRHFRKLLGQEIERSRRFVSPLALLMIDIDHFKAYNDTHGHEFGNEVLRHVSRMIKENLRQTDYLARYGGDEMAVLLPETDSVHAQTLARRLLEDLPSIELTALQTGTPVPISISIGGATFPAHASVLEELIRKADDALYAAKRGGRARLHWAGTPDPIFVLPSRA